MFWTIQRGFLVMLLVTAALLVGRVLTSFAFVAGSVGYSLASGGSADPVQRLATNFTEGMRVLTQTMSPSMGSRRTLSVLDVPAELEARRNAIGTERLPGGAISITVAADRR